MNSKCCQMIETSFFSNDFSLFLKHKTCSSVITAWVYCWSLTCRCFSWISCCCLFANFPQLLSGLHRTAMFIPRISCTMFDYNNQLSDFWRQLVKLDFISGYKVNVIRIQQHSDFVYSFINSEGHPSLLFHNYLQPLLVYHIETH